jgi:hypothetical protein
LKLRISGKFQENKVARIVAGGGARTEKRIPWGNVRIGGGERTARRKQCTKRLMPAFSLESFKLIRNQIITPEHFMVGNRSTG